MGVLTQSVDQNIMKFVLALLFLAGLAFAEPESEASADPAADAWYGYYGLGYGYGRYYGGYYGYPGYYGYGYYGRKKREATAVPEPEPAVLASRSQLVNGPEIVQPYVAAPGVGAIPINPTVTHVGTEHIPGAVAEGEPLPSPGVVHLGYGLPLHHGWGYGYGLAHPPVVAAAPVAAAAAPAEAPAAVDVRKKREAEAEADPESWYYGYYGHGYGGYYGLGYGRYYGGYYGYPYGYYYGK